MSGTSTVIEKQSREGEIKAQRLARRKKILNNAKHRLEKISGNTLSSTSNGGTHPLNTYPEAQLEQNSFDSMLNGQSRMNPGLSSFNMETTEDIFGILERLRQTARKSDDNSVSAILPETGVNSIPSHQMQPKVFDTILIKLIKAKILIALISVLTYILFFTANGYYVSHSVFLPLFLWEIAEILLIHNNESTDASVIVQLLCLLTTFPPNYLATIAKVINALNKIFKDVSMFVFFFTINHIAYSTFFGWK